MDVIQVGPFILNLQLLLFIASAFAGYLALKWRLKQASVDANNGDKFVNALILGFITWKLSLLLFDPVSVFQYPMSLLYYSGGDRGIWLAITVAIMYLGWRIRKDGTSLPMNADVMMTGLLMSISTFHLLLILAGSTNVLYHALSIALHTGLLLMLYRSKIGVGHVGALNQWVMWFCLGRIGVNFLDKERVYDVLSFTLEQILMFIVFILTLWVGNVLDKKKRVNG